MFSNENTVIPIPVNFIPEDPIDNMSASNHALILSWTSDGPVYWYIHAPLGHIILNEYYL